MGNEQWYSNKDLYEEIISLKTEMQETRHLIKNYNGLREELHTMQSKFADFESRNKGKLVVSNGIKDWGGWIVAILALVVSIIKLI